MDTTPFILLQFKIFMLHFPYPSENCITSLGVKCLLRYSQTSCSQPIIRLLYLLKCLQLQSCLFKNSILTPVVEKLVNKLMQIDAGYLITALLICFQTPNEPFGWQQLNATWLITHPKSFTCCFQTRDSQ